MHPLGDPGRLPPKARAHVRIRDLLIICEL